MGSSKKKQKSRNRANPLIEALEPKLLFSADLFGAAVDGAGGDDPVQALLDGSVALQPESDTNSDDLAEQSGAVTPYLLDESEFHSLIGAGDAKQLRSELVFVDPATPDYQQLLDDLLSREDDNRQIEVVLLEADRDGVAQISDVLAGFRELDAVHIISHGSDGSIRIGSSALDQATLDAASEEIRSWSDAFSQDGDLLIYGCDLAATTQGKQFIDSLSILTQADVAASDDLTGHESLGGDWELEYQVGQVESTVIADAAMINDWTDILDPTTGNSSSSGTGAVATATSLTWSHTIGTGSNGILLVEVAVRDNIAVSSVTYGGDVLTQIGAEVSSKTRAEMWYLKAPTAGTANIVVTLASSANFAAGATNFFGVDQTTPYASLTTGNGSGDPSLTVASAAGELVVDVIADRDIDPGGIAVGANQTALWTFRNGDGSNDATGASSIEAGAPSVTMNWTTTGAGAGEWAAMAVSLKPAAATGSIATFQEGASGYAGTQDTYLDESNAASSVAGGSSSIIVDLDHTGGLEAQGLIRFDSLFGSGPGQIPYGSTIHSASLTVNVTNLSVAGANITLHKMLVDWDESSTWNSLSGGLQSASEYTTSASSTLSGPDTTGTKVYTGLAADLQSWLDGGTNYGWAIISDSIDGWDFDSSEGATAGLRPLLTVDFMANQTPTAANNTVTTGEDTTYTFVAGDFNFADTDGDTLSSVKVTSLESTGSLKLNGSDVTLNQVISKADIDAGLLTFAPAANANGNGYDSFGFSVNDGTADSAGSYTMTVDVTAVNDAPIGTNRTITAIEDANYVFTASDFGFSDADGDAFDRVWITTLPSQGTLKWNGSGFSAGNYIMAEDIKLGLLTWTPPANVSGAALTSFTFQVQDDSASSNLDLTPNTITVDVTAVNDAPVLTSPSGTYPYTENAGAVVLGGSATVNDVDSANFDGGQLVYQITNNGLAEDRLDIRHQGTAAGQIGVSGTNITYGGTLIGTYTGAVTGATQLVVSFNASATAAAVEATLKNVIYENTSDNPTASTRTLQVYATDGDGGTSNTLTGYVAVTAVNDDPANLGSLPTDILVQQDSASAVDLSAIDISDVDANGGNLSIRLSTATGGLITAANGAGIIIGNNGTSSITLNGTVSALNTYLNNTSNIQYLHGTPGTWGNDSDTIQVFLNDLGNSGTGGGGDVAIGTFNIDINATPALTADSYNAFEGMPYTAVLGVDGVLENDSDPDADTLTVNTTPVSGPANGQLILNADGSFVYTPDAGFNGTDSFTYQVSDSRGGTAQATATITVLPRDIRILFSTNSDIANSKVPGLDSWESGDVLAIADPNLMFEPAGSDGSILGFMDLESFAADTEMVINGLHFVSNSVTLGSGNAITLQHGDVLFSAQANEVMTSSNSLSVAAGEIVIFRPDTAGDYSAGTFIYLMDQPGSSLTTGITLIEHDVTIGDVTLDAGTLLFTQDDGSANIYHFSADDVGSGTTTGTVSVLIDGADLGLGGSDFVGLMVVTDALHLPGAEVPVGSIITSVSGNNIPVGSNALRVSSDELFYLTVSSTGSGSTDASATLLYDAGDIGLNNENKKIRAFTLIENILPPNEDPELSLSVTSLNYTEGDPAKIIDPAATLTDSDSTNFNGGLLRIDLSSTGTADDRLAINNEGTAAGQVGINGYDVTYGNVVIGTWAGGVDGFTPLTVQLNSNADEAAVQALIRNITYENVSITPSENQRQVQISVSDGDGGTSDIMQAAIVVNGSNAAPVLSGANDLNSINEDFVSNSGTLVSALVAGHVSDIDPSSITGIAVVGVDNSNGTWQFSTDDGGSWTDFGTPSSSNVRLLAGDANTYVRFVPNSNWNGTVSNGITFHAWDQTSGINGDAIDMTAAETIRDEFNSVSYSANDGTDVWTSAWTEVNDDGSAATGDIRIENNKLHISNQDGGSTEYIYRSANLADAVSAAITFDFDAYGGGSIDTISIDVSVDGGTSWLVLRKGTIPGNHSGTRTVQIEDVAPLQDDMLFRFNIVNGMDAPGEYINFDNIDITWTGGGSGGSSSISTATASSGITVNPVNDLPTAANKTVTTDEDVTYTFAASDFNFTDIDGNALSSIKVTSLESAVSLELNGSAVTLNQVIAKANIDSGLLKFVPVANANGSSYDSFGFSVNDGTANSASSYTMTVDVDPVNDLPTAGNNTVTTDEDVTYTFSAGDFNFADIDGDTLASVKVTTLESAGSLELNSSAVTLNQVISKADIDAGKLKFVPVANQNSAGYDSFGFSVNDGTADSASSYTMTVDVDPVNDLPTAANNTVTTDEDVTYTFAAGDFNFADTDGDSLTSVKITSLESVGALQLNGSDVTLNQVISKADIVAGLLTFVPIANQNGAGYDSFGFSVNDGTADSASTYTMTVDVTAVNDAPVATVNTVSAAEDTAYTFSAGDFTFTDVEGNSLVSVTITNQSLASGTLQLSGMAVNNGDTIVAAQLGNLVYTPGANATGAPLATFDFKVNDADLGTVAAQMEIDITPVNDVPVASGNTVIASEDVPLVIGPSDFLFTDVEGDSLVSVTISGLNLSGGTLTHSGGSVNVTNGMTVTAAQLADLTFTSAANSSTDCSFSYTVNDSGSGVTSGVMNITVHNVDDAASISGDTAGSGNEGTVISGDLNATDADGLTDASYFTIKTQGANGSAAIDAETGAWSFTPSDADWFGSDQFTVTVTDDQGGTSDQIINITVNNLDDAANISGDTSGSGNEGSVISGDLNATDADGLTDTSYFTIKTQGANGTAAIDAETGAWSFTPGDADWFGSDQFTVTVTDDQGGTSDQIINITVNNVNDETVGTPTITGIPEIGQTLTTDISAIRDTDGLGTVSYQWLGDGTAISGATNSSYALVAADVGASISVMVHYTDGGGTAETIISTQTGTVAGLVETVNEPQVTDSNSDNASNEAAQPLVELVDEQAEEVPAVEASSDEEKNGETSVADFDFAAMAGEIQPISAAETQGVVTEHDRSRATSDPVSGVGPLIQPKWIDLKHLDIKTFEVEGLEQIQLISVMDNAEFLQGLDVVNHELDEAAKNADAHYELGKEAAVGVTLSLSAGFVSWMLRSGSLIASFMSVVPMWKQLDPLPILGAAVVKGKKIVGVKDGKAKEDREVEDIFDQDDSR